MKIQGWTFRADPWQRVEVMTWRWAGCCPLEGATEAPWVIHRNSFAIAGCVIDIPQEWNNRGTQQHKRHSRQQVQRCESVFNHVVSITTWHPHDAQPVLDQECPVETEEKHPELDFAPSFVEHLPGEFWPPKIEASKHRKHYGTENNVVEMCHNEVSI